MISSNCCSTYSLVASSGQIILGPWSAGHLGDVLCTSPLPRLLKSQGICTYIIEHPNTCAVFQNNPNISGFVTGRSGTPRWLLGTDGHVLQRILQEYELPINPIPKPEIYLDADERAWASAQRQQWPANRPVCILSCTAITDGHNLEQVNWNLVVNVLKRRYTVVQPTLSEPELPDCIAYRNLPVRRYMALFSVAECFFGGTSGGSHLAAAFDVPAVIVLWRTLESNLCFPASGPNFKAMFLYPQHWFICSESLRTVRFDNEMLEHTLDQAMDHGKFGRPLSICNHPLNPCGFLPRSPPRLMRAGGQRFVRVPKVYGC